MDGSVPEEDARLRRALAETTTIAVVGASPDPARPSFGVMAYLLDRGYRVFPVNPRAAGSAILGQPCRARLSDIGETIDMVDIFRNAQAAGAAVDEALALAPRPRVVWMQLGVVNPAAAARAAAAGCVVVMDRCPKIEYGRLFGDIDRAALPASPLPGHEGIDRP